LVAMVEKNKTKKCGGVLSPRIIIIIITHFTASGCGKSYGIIYVRVNKMIVLVIRIGSTQVIKST